MIQAQYRAFLIYLLVLLLPACAAGLSLDSLEDKEAAVKITYSEVLSTAILYKKEGRLSPSQVDKLTDAFNRADILIASLTAYRKAGQRQDFDNSLIAVNAVISTIRGILVEAEQ